MLCLSLRRVMPKEILFPTITTKSGASTMSSDTLRRMISTLIRKLKLKLPQFRRVVLDLGDYSSVMTASIAAS